MKFIVSVFSPKTPLLKSILIMKMVIFLLIASCFQVQAAGQKMSLSKTNAPLKEIFRSIEQQSEYLFIYQSGVVKPDMISSIRVTNKDIRDILDACLQGKYLSYTIMDKNILIEEKIPATVEMEEIPAAQISGVVMDSDGIPLVGASVNLKGKKIGVMTGANGLFSLSVEIGETLVISYIGHKPQEIKITSDKRLVIRLEKTDQTMEGIVISTGVFERPEGNFTGATKIIQGSELKAVSSNNIFAAISALDPSLRIVPNNVVGGNINELPEIQLRGANSFPNLSGEFSANPNAPLFVLDGFEVSLQRVVDLDMNLINSITILKDASATSIYGSRGANGVLVINTIAPKSGKVQVIFNNDFRLTTPDLSVYNLLNSAEKLDFERRSGLYGSGNPNYQLDDDLLYNMRLKAVESGVETDWKSKPVQYGYSNRSALYLSGGDSYVRYGVQLSADLQEGVMKGQNRNNYSGQFDLSYTLKKLRFQNSLRIFQNISNESPYGSFDTYTKMNPYWKPNDENGNVNKIFENNTSYRNPLYDASLHSINRNQYFGFSNNFQLRYNVASWLFLESNLSLNKQTGSSDQFFSAQNTRFAAETDITKMGSYTAGTNNSFGVENLTTANFRKNFGKSLLFSTLGVNVASTKSDFYSIRTVGFPFDRLDNLLFATQYAPNTRPSGDENTIRRMGLLFNASYSYDNRYLLDLSVRKDGSSQFGTDKRFGTFWSAGTGWNLHNEAFLSGSNVINRLKIRGSYGSTGSLNIPAYSAQTRYNFGVDNIYDGQLGSAIMGLGNPNLGWQDVRSLNLGMDLAFLKNRLDIRVDFYRSNTNNAITNVTIAPSTGFAGYVENLGKIQNTGFELATRYKIIDRQRDGIVWSVNFNAFTNKNILKELSNRLRSTNDQVNKNNVQQVVPNIQLQEGESINTIYVVQSLGVDPATGSEIFLKKDGTKTYNWNAADKVPFGIAEPKWNGTFGTNLIYKGFELNLIADYRFGGQLYNQTLIYKVESVNPTYNVDRRAYDLGWKGAGDVSPYTRIGPSKQLTKMTSRFVQDDNVVNLASASFAYQFTGMSFMQKVGLNSLKVTAITNDVFRLSSIDIERGTSNPFSRTFSLSVRAGF